MTGVLERARADEASTDRIEQLRKHRDALAARLRRLENDNAELAAIFQNVDESWELEASATSGVS